MDQAEVYIINTWELFERFKKYVSGVPSDTAFFDTETDGLAENLNKVYGLSISFNDTKAFYIPLRSPPPVVGSLGTPWWENSQQEAILAFVEGILNAKGWVGHNAGFDALIMKYNYGWNIVDSLKCDTMLLHHTIEEEPPHGLKPLAVKDLGEGYDFATKDLEQSVLSKGGKWNADEKDMYIADTDILGKYACWDVILTCKLYMLYSARLKNEGLEDFFYKDEVMPLYKEVTIPMKDSGFPIDLDHYKAQLSDITKDIDRLERTIYSKIVPDVQPFIKETLDKNYPVKNTGNFAKVLFDHLGVPLPKIKKKNKETGEITYAITLSKPAILKQKEVSPEYSKYYDWILEGGQAPVNNLVVDIVQRELFHISDKGENPYIFNIGSDIHLGYYFFTVKGYTPLGRTKTGQGQVNEAFFEYLEQNFSDDVIRDLLDWKKLKKLKSTYLESMIELSRGGRIYSSMLQHGTTSGRYSSAAPNLQNCPRIKDEDSKLSPLVLKYSNAIRKGMISGPGRKLVNADFSQLEVACFAHMSGSKELQEVFTAGHDLYSKIAIDIHKLQGTYSADKKSDRYLKNFEPELRNQSKIFCLAVVYGANASRISQALNCDFQTANRLINAYLTAYPSLKKYMISCDFKAKTKGYVETQFGRIRHIPKAKEIYEQYGDIILDYKWAKAKGLELVRREYKKYLNNAKNFPIQGLAASIVNRSAIAIMREFKARNLDASIILQVHDELTSLCRDEDAEEVRNIMRQCMENTVKLSVPLTAEPLIADNWADAK